MGGRRAGRASLTQGICVCARRVTLRAPLLQSASLVRLRVLFFLLLDRDTELKDKVLAGWPEWCVAGVERKKANGFFQNIRAQVIEPWLVDERRCEDDFVSSCIDLYLVM